MSFHRESSINIHIAQRSKNKFKHQSGQRMHDDNDADFQFIELHKHLFGGNDSNIPPSSSVECK